MENKSWRDDPPTQNQIESIAKMSRTLNKEIKLVRTKGEATDLILKLKQDWKDESDRMKKYFDWQ